MNYGASSRPLGTCLRTDHIARVLDLGAVDRERGRRKETQSPKWRGGEAYVFESVLVYRHICAVELHLATGPDLE